MFALFAPIARLFTEGRTPVSTGVARRLLESAGASAGHDSRHAEELRAAAYAYLRVVR
ncbi:MAG: hypothetical protein V4787_13125 [Pseudomonadota bacterium]